jgi:hypothetical protein
MTRYSLDVLGVHEGSTLLYTAPAKADELTTKEQLEGFRALLAPYIAKPWIWIFDGGGMTVRHYTNLNFCTRMYSLITTEHNRSLQSVWFLNMNPWLRGVLQIFPISKPIVQLPTERLEMFVSMQRKGVPSSVIDTLISLSPQEHHTPMRK